MRLFSIVLLAASLLAGQNSSFFIQPWLQPGPTAGPDSVEVLWALPDSSNTLTLEYRSGNSWTGATPALLRSTVAKEPAPHHIFHAVLSNLKPGAKFDYRFRQDGKTVFEATGMARRAEGEESRFVVFGDTSANTSGQKKIAHLTHKLNPDFVYVTGDVVYSYGQQREYMEKFFPIFNHDAADPKKGAPLIRSRLMYAGVGNHDVGTKVDLDARPDLLGFFYYFQLPRNGPVKENGAPGTSPVLGEESLRAATLNAVRETWPAMGNYTFTAGNTAWVVLDTNKYVDWSRPEMMDWVRTALTEARKAKWLIVGIHHPPFNSSGKHADDQRVRVLSSLFAEMKVDLVLAGHVHNYQRTRPLTFQTEAGFVLGKNDKVPGEWTLDEQYDGAKNTQPRYPIYLVTGAGGASLYDGDQTTKPESWKPFTVRFHATNHSLTLIESSDRRMTVRQLDENNKEIDRFQIDRP
jgi:acid phosphatase type 7